MSDEALNTVDDEVTVVEEIRSRDFNAADEECW